MLLSAFLRRPREGWLSLFPSEEVAGVAIPIAESRALFPRYSLLYRSILEEVVPKISTGLGVPPDAGAVFARRALVPQIQFFLDRLLRLDRLIRRHPADRIAVASAPPFEPLKDIQEFEVFGTQSASFNQAMLCRLAPLWGLEVGPEPNIEQSEIPANSEAGFVNHNFKDFSLWEKARKIFRRNAVRTAGAILSSRGARLPAIHMGYDTAGLESQGFFARQDLIRIAPPILEPKSRPLQDGLRRFAFIKSLESCSPALDQFLSEAEVADPGVRLGAARNLGRFLALMTPANLLEDVPFGLPQFTRLLSPHRARPLLVEEFPPSGSTYAIAAARSLGMTVIGCQHGGGYGYLDSIAGVAELEFPLCDGFISWGWRRPADAPGSPAIRVIPLPSPWLSERVKAWRRRRRLRPLLRTRTRRDLLLMSDKILNFPRPGIGLDAPTPDHIQDQAAMLKSLVEEAGRLGVSVLHKPHNQKSVALMPETHAALRRLGGAIYFPADRTDKGLNPGLVEQVKLVVWDKPGTGFLECAASGIPTMILWGRFSAEAAPRAEPIFHKLEARGVVHREARTLLAEYIRFRSNPKGWMGEPARRRDLKRFLRTYGWTRDDWAPRWRHLLRSLGNGKIPA